MSRHGRSRDTPGMAIQQPGHCTPLFLALVLACGQKQTWHRSRIVVCIIVRLNISHSPELWRSLTFPVDITEMGMGNCNATSSTRWNQGRNGALPRCHIAPPRWLLPTLPYSPPHANSEGSAAAWWNGTARRCTLKMRVECSKNTR